jgi:hypothetical protein
LKNERAQPLPTSRRAGTLEEGLPSFPSKELFTPVQQEEEEEEEERLKETM